MTNQVFGKQPFIQIFKIPFPRNKFHGVYLKGMTPSPDTVSEKALADIDGITGFAKDKALCQSLLSDGEYNLVREGCLQEVCTSQLDTIRDLVGCIDEVLARIASFRFL